MLKGNSESYSLFGVKLCSTRWDSLIFCGLFMLMMPRAAFAEESPLLIAPTLANLIDEQGQGVYQQVMRLAAEQAGLELREEVHPIKRAVKKFIETPGSCIYTMIDPALEQFGEAGIVTSYPFGAAKLYIFTAPDSQPISSWLKLKGLRVIAPLGYESYLQELVDGGIDIQFVGNDISNLEMLLRGRTDAILGFLPDYNPFVDQLVFNKQKPLATYDDSLTCQNTATNRRFIVRISNELIEIKRKGLLRQILADYYLDFDYQPQHVYQYRLPWPVRQK